MVNDNRSKAPQERCPTLKFRFGEARNETGCWCARQGARTMGVKVPRTPGKESVKNRGQSWAHRHTVSGSVLLWKTDTSNQQREGCSKKLHLPPEFNALCWESISKRGLANEVDGLSFSVRGGKSL